MELIRMNDKHDKHKNLQNTRNILALFSEDTTNGNVFSMFEKW